MANVILVRLSITSVVLNGGVRFGVGMYKPEELPAFHLVYPRQKQGRRLHDNHSIRMSIATNEQDPEHQYGYSYLSGFAAPMS